MRNLTLAGRVSGYRTTFPKYPPPRADERWMDGMWILGNSYKGTGYYGAYPGNYLKRVMSLFPDAQRILHLFSGSLPAGPYVRFDMKDADIRGDAHALPFEEDAFDLIVADPPYEPQHAARYGMPMINRRKVLGQCSEVLEAGGYLVWLDTMLPMFRKTELHWCGSFGIVVSTNHRFRVCSIFKRV